MVIFTHNIAKFAITDEYHIDREIRDWEQLETDREISEMALENGRMVIITLKTEAAGDPTAFQD